MAGNHNSGRHAFPASHHVETGNYRPVRHGPIPDPAEGLPKCPAKFDAVHRAAWKYLVDPLIEMGTAKLVDEPLLIQMVQAWVKEQGLAKKIGTAQDDGRMARQADVYQQRFERLRRHFGGTPRDRQRMRLKKKDDSGPKGLASRTRTSEPPVLPLK